MVHERNKRNKKRNKQQTYQYTTQEPTLPSKLYWPQLRSFLRRLPTELLEEVYSYTLIPSTEFLTPIHLYFPEDSESSDLDISPCLNFYFSPAASPSEQASALRYYLRQNVFYCYEEEEVETLVSRLKSIGIAFTTRWRCEHRLRGRVTISRSSSYHGAPCAYA